MIQKIEKYDIMREETKDAVLEGVVECPGFVYVSVYDPNPVHFLSTSDENLVCNINEKEIYDKATNKKI